LFVAQSKDLLMILPEAAPIRTNNLRTVYRNI
jgi:hypothetical protein